MKGICDVNAQRIVEGSLTFTHPSNPSELPLIRFYLMRHFPSIEDPIRPSLHELTVANIADVKIKDVWAGDSQVKFFEFMDVPQFSRWKVG